MDVYQSFLFTMIIVLVLAAILCLVIGNLLNNKSKFKVTKSKKRVSSSQVSRKMIGGKFAQDFNDKAKPDKKYKIETRILNAGFSFSYGEYIVLCITCALVVPILVMLAMKNIYMAIVLSIVSLFAPGQLIKYIANSRIRKMEDQVGSFMRLVMERYKTNKDMSLSIVNTLPDFLDCEPLYRELRLTVVDINLGIPCADAIDSFARRTGNKFMSRFGDYYRVAESLSTFTAKVELLSQAYMQYLEDVELKRMLKKEISGPVGESYLMVGMTPVFMLWQGLQDKSYWDYMLNEQLGQIGLTVIFVVLLLCVVFINVKIGGPLE